MGAGNLDGIDAKSRLGDCAAELNSDGRVFHCSNRCAGSLGKLPQRVRTIPQAPGVLRAQSLEGPSGILRVAIGIKSGSRSIASLPSISLLRGKLLRRLRIL